MAFLRSHAHTHKLPPTPTPGHSVPVLPGRVAKGPRRGKGGQRHLLTWLQRRLRQQKKRQCPIVTAPAILDPVTPTPTPTPSQSRKRQAHASVDTVSCIALPATKRVAGVSFGRETKTHDGLTTDAYAFDVLIKRYCSGADITTALDVVRTVKECVLLPVITLQNMKETMLGVLARVEDLLDRLLSPKQKAMIFDAEVVSTRLDLAVLPEVPSSVPVLPHGGGSCCKLSRSAAPYVKTLLPLVKEAVAVIEAALCS